VNKTVIILCVSREILEGAVVDRNAAFMAARVTDLGFRVRSIQVLDRVEAEMVGSLELALDDKPAYILVTGGLGPGVDDNTRACLAKAAGVGLVENKQSLAQIATAYRRLQAAEVIEDGGMNPDRARMAMVPEGAITYENPIGTAPAVQLAIGPTTVFLLPGVPAEMQRLFLLHVVPTLSKQGPQTIRRSRHIDFPSRDESSLGRVLSDIGRRHRGVMARTHVQGTNQDIVIRITLQAEHTDPVELDALLERAELDLRARLGLEGEVEIRESNVDIE
jgi:molybdopterin-biosynthesis enzyme MoeA-like protein